MTSTAVRIAFLYNHEAVHQVRHTVSIAAALARMRQVQVSILASTQAQLDEARKILAAGGPAEIEMALLRPGAVARGLGPLLALAGPFGRLSVLFANRRLFDGFDALVVPETTSLMLRDSFGVKKPRLVWVPHGAGDRSVGFRKVASGFDLVLVAGAKTYRRMLGAGIVTEQTCRIVGYPKFDTLDPAAELPPLFANQRPTVVYNPHFDPRLSSWYEMGEAVLDWFARQDRFNLIFAPHVMLFRRRIHASVEHRIVKWRHDVQERYRHLPHLLIDTGSARSSDMTYTRSADIYLGDASSQIYEWIARPRPAIFLNPRELEWQGDENFAHWHLGEVVPDMAGMTAALDRALDPSPALLERQAEAFAQTFSVEPLPAANRAANVIAGLFANGCEAP